MFHDDFRPRKRLHLIDSDNDQSGSHYYKYHQLVAGAIDAALDAVPEDPTRVREVGDLCAELLLNAMSRFHRTQVEDPFGIYGELVLLPRSVLQDIYNHLLTDDELPAGCVAGPWALSGQH